jgi:16S rRNA (guanine527-N7)-methyltransferase
MRPDRIAELLAPFLEPANAGEKAAALSNTQLQHVSTYIDMLLYWNSRINLTAIRDPEEIVTRHFGESFFVARQLFPVPIHDDTDAIATNFRLADLGSGAGFPGIPIKLWTPEIALTLIESNHKKATFLREICRALFLQKVEVENARAESLPSAAFNEVVLRAVENFEDILPDAARILAGAGRLALSISSLQVEQARSILKNFSWAQPIPVPHSNSRVLLIGQKES